MRFAKPGFQFGLRRPLEVRVEVVGAHPYPHPCRLAYLSDIHLRRGRSALGERGDSIRRYREAVNRVTLAALWSLANAKSLPLAEREIGREPDLRLLHQIVILTQVIDDVLDVRRDRRRGLPSFATASDATPTMLREIASSYGNSSAIQVRGNLSLRVARRIVWLVARTMISLVFGVTRQAGPRATKARPVPVLEQG